MNPKSMMAMEERHSRVVGDEVEFDFQEASDSRHP
jgi:hypothetical protein